MDKDLGIAVTSQIGRAQDAGSHARREQLPVPDAVLLICNRSRVLAEHDPSPRIDIGITQQDEETVFFVRDNGMGIDPAQTKRIFQLFSQLNHGSDGVGLGLALVKKFVNSYDGRIWAESGGLGQGSTFFFTLPGALGK